MLLLVLGVSTLIIWNSFHLMPVHLGIYLFSISFMSSVPAVVYRNFFCGINELIRKGKHKNKCRFISIPRFQSIILLRFKYDDETGFFFSFTAFKLLVWSIRFWIQGHKILVSMLLKIQKPESHSEHPIQRPVACGTQFYLFIYLVSYFWNTILETLTLKIRKRLFQVPGTYGSQVT